ncbi:MAG: zinc ABC transporter solute-binding protein, partial [Verrucomicrobia bacterium]|nr:zinc ABC transporter solute-binding protein [Verrucomicrobiota bacterium]
MEKDQSYLLRKNQWQKSFLIKASTFFLLITGFTTSYAQKLQVVTTTTMISDAVEQVGGNRVHVNGLMGPGVDPHLYKPAASDVIKLS